jgi:tRNA threonylcarbamoyladenosine biosynthesis protein TsaB
MKLLAFDTATEVCSVALWQDGAVIEYNESGSRHAEIILGMVRRVLAEGGIALTQLDAIAFGRGPGSFTGLRIGAGVTQGLAFGADLPVVPVSSLAAIAQSVDAPNVLAALDARMHQVYWGAYVRQPSGLVDLEGDECVIAPVDVPVPEEGAGWIGAGSGWDEYHTTLALKVGNALTDWRPGVIPSARAIAALGAQAFATGRTVPPDQAVPVYIRDDVARKQKSATR